MTDAGFKTSWFHSVAQEGWFYIGRVRGLIRYHLDALDDWICRRKNNIHHDFQANTVRTHRVLSWVYLAKQMVVQGVKNSSSENYNPFLIYLN